MYSRCIACRRSLGTNTLIADLPIGRRIAYETENGRLWVVCHHCWQWNLTPFEERWEALEQCEAAFQKSVAHADAAGIALAKNLDGTELIRIGGSATSSDIANFRYGRRLQHRRDRFMIAGTLVGGLFFIALLALYNSIEPAAAPWVVLWLVAFLMSWKEQLPAAFSWWKVARYRMPSGDWTTIRRFHLGRMAIESAGKIPHYTLVCPLWRKELRLNGTEAAEFLAVILPRGNWRSGTLAEINEAVRVVERAEARQPSAGSLPPPPPVWERLLHGQKGKRLLGLPSVRRLALEMAVTEERELRIMKGAALQYRLAWESAEKIAAIADSLLIPQFVTDWLARRKRPAGGGSD